MATVEEQVKELNAQRIRAWENGKDFIERAVSEKRGMNAEELAAYQRSSEEVDSLEKTRDALLASDAARREIETVNEEFRRVATPGERQEQSRRDDNAEAEMRSLFRSGKGMSMQDHLHQVNSMDLDLSVPAAYFAAQRAGIPFNELRVIQTDAGASGGSLTVPTTVATTVYAFLTQSVSARRVARIITTAGGAPMAFPRVSTHSVATQIASQTTAVSGTDSVLSSMTLSAYDYGELVAVSQDMLDDSGVDVVGFVAEQIGRALGIVVGADYITGSGSSKPTGVITAAPAGAAGTIATGGTTTAQAFPTGMVDAFISLQYSVADGYRQRNPAFMVNQYTGGTLRKSRDGAGGTIGQYLWQPSPTVGLIPGQPDRFLGDPIVFDPNIASIASDAKIAVYGDWSAFYIRDARTLTLERSNDLYFNLNQIAFRGILRTDSNLIDTKALNVLHQAVT